VKYLTLESFTDFFCIGSECQYTCCQDWKIPIDEETYHFYQSVDGEMGERLKNSIHYESGDAWIILREEDAHCPFLNEEGLCSVYLTLGEGSLSNICASYPRYLYYAGDICFAVVSISCPEAARLYLTHKDPLLIDFGENDDNSGVDPNTDWELFNRAIRVFTTAVSIAQNRDFSVKERVALITLFVNGFQTSVNEESDPSEMTDLYSNPEYYRVILDQTDIRICDLESKVSFVTNILYIFRDTEYLDKKLPELEEVIEYFDDPDNTSVDREVWENAFRQATSSDNEIWRENVLVYVLFKYFMGGLSERDFYERLMTGIGPILNISTCITALYDIIHGEEPSMDYIIMLVTRLSRIVEHNRSVGETVSGYFRKMGFTDPGFLLKLIS